SLNDLIALRVNTRQPILTRLLPYDLPRCPQPTGARVRSIPPCTFVPMPPVTIEAGEDEATCAPMAIPVAGRGDRSTAQPASALSWRRTARSCTANTQPSS